MKQAMLILLSVVGLTAIHSVQERPSFRDRAAYREWLYQQAEEAKNRSKKKKPMTQEEFDAEVRASKAQLENQDSAGCGQLLVELREEKSALALLTQMREQGVTPTDEFLAKLEKTLGKKPGALKEWKDKTITKTVL